MDNLIKYAMSWIGVPYKWGGENFNGIDCSGLVRQILKSVGRCPSYDLTAYGLYNYFLKDENGYQLDKPQAGALIFFGDGEKIRHTGFAIDGWRMIEAAGGTRNIVTHADADAANAFVKISIINSRNDYYAALMPHYPQEVYHD